MPPETRLELLQDSLNNPQVGTRNTYTPEPFPVSLAPLSLPAYLPHVPINPGSHQRHQSRTLFHGFRTSWPALTPPPLPVAPLSSPRSVSASIVMRVCVRVAVGGVPDRDRRGAAGRPTRRHRPQKGAPTNRPSPSFARPARGTSFMLPPPCVIPSPINPLPSPDLPLHHHHCTDVFRGECVPPVVVRERRRVDEAAAGPAQGRRALPTPTKGIHVS